MTPLVWSKEPPTEPGWYWAFEPGTTDPVVVEVIEDLPTTLCIWDGGVDGCAVSLSAMSRWAGPIPQPAEPTGADGLMTKEGEQQ